MILANSRIIHNIINKINIMSRIINIVLLLVFTTQFSLACDVCGCGVGTSCFGIMPNIQGHFIGLKAQYGRFHSEHPPLFSDSKPIYGDEAIYNLSLWSRVALSQRLHLYIDLPYQSIHSTENGVTNVYSGIGDIGLMANYFVFNRLSWDFLSKAINGYCYEESCTNELFHTICFFVNGFVTR